MKQSNLSRELTIETKLDGEIINISENCYNILGYGKDELLFKNINELLVTKIEFALLENLNNSYEITIRSKKGNILYMDTSIYLNEENNEYEIFISMIDITKHKLREIKNKHILNIIDRSKDFIYSIKIKPKFEVEYVSSGIYDMLGYKPEEYYNNPYLIFNNLYYKDLYVKHSIKNNEYDFSKPIVVRYKHKEGYHIWIENYARPIYDNNDLLIGFDGIIRNIQDRKELEKKLLYLSYHDSLTGLYNRSYFDKIRYKLNNIKNTSFGIIIVDLDNLKNINDTYGHNLGDKLIKITSSIIKKSINKKDMAFRYGGDEFIIILEDIDSDLVINTVKNLKSKIKLYNDKNRIPNVKASIGYSFSEYSHNIFDEVFIIADKNMYENKKRKNKRIV